MLQSVHDAQTIQDQHESNSQETCLAGDCFLRLARSSSPVEPFCGERIIAMFERKLEKQILQNLFNPRRLSRVEVFVM